MVQLNYALRLDEKHVHKQWKAISMFQQPARAAAPSSVFPLAPGLTRKLLYRSQSKSY